MPDGPVAAAIVLAIGLALLALGYFVTEARRPENRRHRRHRESERLPLFGTDRLVLRADDDGDDADAEAIAAPPRRAVVQASANGKQRAAPAASAPSGGAPAGGAASGDAPSSGAEPAGAPPANTPPASQPIVRSAPVTAPWQRPARSRDGETRRNGTNAAAAAERFAPAPGLDDPSLGFAGRSDGPAVDGAAASARAPVAQPPRAAPSAGAFPAPDGQRGDAAFVDGETLRFAVPTDGTLQFLPGRLEVVAGPDSGREVRFVRIPGDPAVRVTFGRSEGPPYRHVQLHARTVSRQHAEMQLTDEHWELRNLSTTNPVVLNGRLLAHDEVAPLLVQGDRIEMGEVVFVFHER